MGVDICSFLTFKRKNDKQKYPIALTMFDYVVFLSLSIVFFAEAVFFCFFVHKDRGEEIAG